MKKEKIKIIFEEDPVWLYNTNTEWCQYCFNVIVDNQKISFCPDIVEPCTSVGLIKKEFSDIEGLINFVRKYLEDHSLSPERDFQTFLEVLKERNLVK